MPTKTPPLPGRSLQRDCIEELDLTIARTAEHLQVDEQVLTDVCHCRASITADLAVRIDMALGGGADTWLAMQTAHDLAQARKSACEIKRIERAA
ncbi:MAG: HigA family addiction module antitoxin [Chloroflexi bacterium]|nr:HigA family addiction module antitoxin [Chloroflexota bacterium]MCY3695534.1 HigA family addiction module antitoxin [Chloroflexota bacterium]